jgi:mono/diheme cytochrome c family protein
MTNRIWCCAGAVLISAGVLGSWAAAQERPRADYNSGSYLYRAYCASCHGQNGRGDGPVADLEPRQPADLTALASQHGGVFPKSDVREVLEGKKAVAAHQPPAMPNWRVVLLRTEGGDERAVNARLDALVAFVESLQK